MQPSAQRKDDAQNGRGIKNAMSCGKNAYRKGSDFDLVARLDEAHARGVQPVLFGMRDARCRDIDGAHALGKGVDVLKMIEVRVRDKNGFRRARLRKRDGRNGRILFEVWVDEQTGIFALQKKGRRSVPFESHWFTYSLKFGIL